MSGEMTRIERLLAAGDALANLFNEHGEHPGHVLEALHAKTEWFAIREELTHAGDMTDLNAIQRDLGRSTHMLVEYVRALEERVGAIEGRKPTRTISAYTQVLSVVMSDAERQWNARSILDELVRSDQPLGRKPAETAKARIRQALLDLTIAGEVSRVDYGLYVAAKEPTEP